MKLPYEFLMKNRIKYIITNRRLTLEIAEMDYFRLPGSVIKKLDALFTLRFIIIDVTELHYSLLQIDSNYFESNFYIKQAFQKLKVKKINITGIDLVKR
jgi:hypothetical protein